MIVCGPVSDSLERLTYCWNILQDVIPRHSFAFEPGYKPASLVTLTQSSYLCNNNYRHLRPGQHKVQANQFPRNSVGLATVTKTTGRLDPRVYKLYPPPKKQPPRTIIMPSYPLKGQSPSKGKGHKGKGHNGGSEGIALNEFQGADDDASTKGQAGTRNPSVASSHSGGKGKSGSSGKGTSGKGK